MRHLLNFLYTGQTCLREAEIQELRELIKLLDIKTDIWDEPSHAQDMAVSLDRGRNHKNGLVHDKPRPNGVHPSNDESSLREEAFDYSARHNKYPRRDPQNMYKGEYARNKVARAVHCYTVQVRCLLGPESQALFPTW